MKMNKLIATATVALAGAALLNTSAMALTAATGDLILGFQTGSPNTGNNLNLELNLGAASAFTALEGTGDVINLTAGSSTAGFGSLNVSDLIADYGSSWTSDGLAFGVAGTLGSTANNELFVSYFSGTPTTVANQSTRSNRILGLYNTYLGGTVGANNSTDATVQTSATGSYTFEASNSGKYANNFPLTTQVNVTSSGESISLYDVQQGIGAPVTLVGTFNLDGSGDLLFTATSAVPEPSTYAMFGLGAVALFFARRRFLKA